MAAVSNGSEYFELQIDAPSESSFARPSNADSVKQDEDELIWEAISRLPSQKQERFAQFKRTASEYGDDEGERKAGHDMVDVTKLNKKNRELVVRKALATNAQDNYQLLNAVKQRLERVGLEVTKVEVRYENVTVVAKVQTGSRALPTLLNFSRNTIESLLKKMKIFLAKRFPLTILNGISGVVKPGRMILLLGPPGSGKTSSLLALSWEIG